MIKTGGGGANLTLKTREKASGGLLLEGRNKGIPMHWERSLYAQFVLKQAGGKQALIESISWSCPGDDLTTSLPYSCNEPRICVLRVRAPHWPC